MEPAEPRALVAIATYNERENLAGLVQEIHRYCPQVDILVIDDNSPDGTGALADQFAQSDPRIHVLHRAGKLGLGTAILAGMRYSIDRGYDIFLSMDADFSHHPRYMPAILAVAKTHDVMIGSRYIPGGGTVNWPLSRKFMSWAVNTLCRVLMRFTNRDVSGGYRAYRVDLLRRTNIGNIVSRGYSFQEEVLFRCKQAGGKFGETPIIFEDRLRGGSKANLKEIVRSTSILVYLGVRATLGLPV